MPVACQQSLPYPQVLREPASYLYSAFGLTIESALALPQLGPAPQGTEPDLRLALGPVEASLLFSEPGYRRGRIYDQFRYEVIAGRDIVIDPLVGSSPKNIADGIMSRVLTVAVYQRGLLPLHASAVSYRGRTIAICGPSGAGKSTLAAFLALRGGRVLADDMLVLSASGDPRKAWPGACGLKLSEASLTKISRTSEGLSLANEAEGKFFLPLEHFLEEREVALSALIRLHDGPRAVRRIPPLRALSEWTNCIRQPELMEVAPDPAILWRRWLDLAACVSFVSVSHGREMIALDRIVEDLDIWLDRHAEGK